MKKLSIITAAIIAISINHDAIASKRKFDQTNITDESAEKREVKRQRTSLQAGANASSISQISPDEREDIVAELFKYSTQNNYALSDKAKNSGIIVDLVYNDCLSHLQHKEQDIIIDLIDGLVEKAFQNHKYAFAFIYSTKFNKYDER